MKIIDYNLVTEIVPVTEFFSLIFPLKILFKFFVKIKYLDCGFYFVRRVIICILPFLPYLHF